MLVATAPILQINALTKVYGRLPVVSNVSLDVQQGEFLSIIGPSGSGKSTILKMITGIIPPTSGQILLRGQDISSLPQDRLGIVMVWQSLALFPHMNVAENVGFGLAVRGVEATERERRINRYLEMVDLQGFEQRAVQGLSGGEQQRAALARALIVEPDVLLLDEPLGGLDKHRRAQMLRKLREIHRLTGVTVLMVTHDQGEAMITSSRLAILNRGSIEQVGSPLEVSRTPKTAFVARFVGHKNVFPATVTAVTGSQIVVKAADNILVGSRPEWIKKEIVPGTAVAYVVDANKVMLGMNGDNRLTGRLDVRSVGGAIEVVEAAVPGLGTVRCERPVNSASESGLPDPLPLSWLAGDGYVLPDA